MINANEHSPAPQTPAELLAIEAGLDRLGSLDRASAPAGFEDRLLAATSTHLRQPVAEQADVIATIGPAHTRAWRMAASIAVVSAGILGASWLASRGPATSTQVARVASTQTIESDLKSVNAELATVMAAADSTSLTTSDDYASLDSELAALETELSDFGWDDSLDGLLEDSL